MSTPLNSAGPSRRAAVAAAALAVGAIGCIAAISMTGSAQADQPAREISGDSVSGDSVSPTFGTFPPFSFVTIPPPTLLTLPPLTFVTVPGTSTTTIEETTTTTETTTTLETSTSTTEAPTTTPNVGQPSAEPVYTLVIDLAQINCDGTIHVEYLTTADPEPAGPANHMVVYNPTSNPAEFHIAETAGNASNGAFAFDEPGVTDQTYRLFVIGLFDPANPDGPKAIDQADVVLVGGC